MADETLERLADVSELSSRAEDDFLRHSLESHLPDAKAINDFWQKMAMLEAQEARKQLQ